MERSYACKTNKSMKVKDLTNAEILYKSDLKNKVLIQVPNTKFHILCSYIKSTDKWDIHLMELISSKRKKLAENLQEKIVSAFVTKIVNDGQNLSLKYTTTIKIFSQYLTKQIKKNESRQCKINPLRGSRQASINR